MKNNEENIKAISAVSAAVVQAWNDGNYEGFMEHLDKNAIVIPQAAGSVVGIDALRTLYNDSFKTFNFEVKEILDEITVFGDYGYTVGTWVGSMNPRITSYNVCYTKLLRTAGYRTVYLPGIITA